MQKEKKNPNLPNIFFFFHKTYAIDGYSLENIQWGNSYEYHNIHCIIMLF